MQFEIEIPIPSATPKNDNQKEYKRVFTDKNGKVKPLARNKFFKKYFLDN